MNNTEKMICIQCPLGCELTVEKIDEDIRVTGHSCPKGITFAKEEKNNPKRMLTTVVSIKGTDREYLPVISQKPIPKGKMRDALSILRNVEVELPITMDTIVFSNILDTGTDIVAAKSKTKLIQG